MSVYVFAVRPTRCRWRPLALFVNIHSIVAAVKEQAEKAVHVQLTIVASQPIATLMTKLRDHVVPKELSRFFFNSASSGARVPFSVSPLQHSLLVPGPLLDPSARSAVVVQ